MIRIVLGSLCVFGFLTLGLQSLRAQVDADYEQGLKPYGTYESGKVDAVSMTNGNLTVQIPLLSYPQRGGLHLDYELVWNNKT